MSSCRAPATRAESADGQPVQAPQEEAQEDARLVLLPTVTGKQLRLTELTWQALRSVTSSSHRTAFSVMLPSRTTASGTVSSSTCRPSRPRVPTASSTLTRATSSCT